MAIPVFGRWVELAGRAADIRVLLPVVPAGLFATLSIAEKPRAAQRPTA